MVWLAGNDNWIGPLIRIDCQEGVGLVVALARDRTAQAKRRPHGTGLTKSGSRALGAPACRLGDGQRSETVCPTARAADGGESQVGRECLTGVNRDSRHNEGAVRPVGSRIVSRFWLT